MPFFVLYLVNFLFYFYLLIYLDENSYKIKCNEYLISNSPCMFKKNNNGIFRNMQKIITNIFKNVFKLYKIMVVIILFLYLITTGK